MTGEIKGISLYELQKRVKESIAAAFTTQIWVRGEVNNLKVTGSGHCYLDLVDKEEGEEGIRAKAQAIVWNSSWRILQPYFESHAGIAFEPGISILVKAQVNYSELYGLSLIVYDIDPVYSVGELELIRQQIIQRLQQEGMFEMNTTLELPAFPCRFAVISAETAAGYQDFMRHLFENEYGFHFIADLYPAPMQGAAAPQGIIAALDRIMEAVQQGKEYDAVLLLRGGGSNVDLHCFDDYELSANVAQFPLPVLTAIGHDKDYHIVDMVACRSVKTPTALADFILNIFISEQGRILEMSLSLDSLLQRLKFAFQSRWERERHRLEILEQHLLRNDPRNIVKKGYSIPTAGARKITSVEGLKIGDLIRMELQDGIVEAEVKNILPKTK